MRYNAVVYVVSSFGHGLLFSIKLVAAILLVEVGGRTRINVEQLLRREGEGISSFLPWITNIMGAQAQRSRNMLGLEAWATS